MCHGNLKKLAAGVLMVSLLGGSVFLVGSGALAKDQTATVQPAPTVYFYETVFARESPNLDSPLNHHTHSPQLPAGTAIELLGLTLAALVGLVAGMTPPKTRTDKLNQLPPIKPRIRIRHPVEVTHRSVPKPALSAARRDISPAALWSNSAASRTCRKRIPQCPFTSRPANPLRSELPGKALPRKIVLP